VHLPLDLREKIATLHAYKSSLPMARKGHTHVIVLSSHARQIDRKHALIALILPYHIPPPPQLLLFLAVGAALAAPGGAKAKPKKSSYSVQEVDFGVGGNGISKYRTEIINESQVNLEDRRKTPEPQPKKKQEPSKHKYKREAEAGASGGAPKPWPKPQPKPQPKPKSSMSYQEVELTLPGDGISRYSTKIINEKKAIEDVRYRTPVVKQATKASKKHKREAEASKYAPPAQPSKPRKSHSIQSVKLGLPGGGISSYSTAIRNEKIATLEDRRKTPVLAKPKPKKHY